MGLAGALGMCQGSAMPQTVQYRRGKDIPLADALSRVSPTPVEEDGIQLPIVTVNLITSSVPVSSSEIEMILWRDS